MISKETDEQIRFFYNKSFYEMNEIEKQQISDISINRKKFDGKNTETTIAEVLEFPNLRKCTINGFNITEEDIKTLNKCKNLKDVQFSNCSFTDANISLKNIESLVIDNCRGKLERIFEKLEQLKVLHIVGHEPFDIAYIEKCKELKRIYIQDTTIKRVGQLKNFKELEYVNLSKSKFNQIAFALLKNSCKFEIDYDKDVQIKVG